MSIFINGFVLDHFLPTTLFINIIHLFMQVADVTEQLKYVSLMHQVLDKQNQFLQQ
jgi:hypothetical protein